MDSVCMALFVHLLDVSVELSKVLLVMLELVPMDFIGMLIAYLFIVFIHLTEVFKLLLLSILLGFPSIFLKII